MLTFFVASLGWVRQGTSLSVESGYYCPFSDSQFQSFQFYWNPEVYSTVLNPFPVKTGNLKKGESRGLVGLGPYKGSSIEYMDL